jgi:hypothetical protein
MWFANEEFDIPQLEHSPQNQQLYLARRFITRYESVFWTYTLELESLMQ